MTIRPLGPASNERRRGRSIRACRTCRAIYRFKSNLQTLVLRG